ncbi:MAG TPA: peptidylprolyl isomerase [Streptosporangiaceae bacterium]
MAGRRERQRKLARERLERRAVKQAQHDRKVRQLGISALAAVAVAAIVVGGVFLFKPSSHPAAAAASPPSPAPSSAAPSPSASPAAVVQEPAHHCSYTAGGTAARKVKLPSAKPDFKAGYQATITTNRGVIKIKLLNSEATCTVNSFVSLAMQKYFNHTPCHRLVTQGIYVLQCGDPTGKGTGGPGYSFSDENLTKLASTVSSSGVATYKTATVAMANSGPNTNGSQFFLVYQNSPLQPNYTPFGTITGGLKLIQQVAKAGSDNSNGAGDGHPKEKVTIERVTIEKT